MGPFPDPGDTTAPSPTPSTPNTPPAAPTPAKKSDDGISSKVGSAISNVGKQIADQMAARSQQAISSMSGFKTVGPSNPSVSPLQLPQYKRGTARVPKTGPAVLHKNEAVVTAPRAAKMRRSTAGRKFLSGRGGGR